MIRVSPPPIGRRLVLLLLTYSMFCTLDSGLKPAWPMWPKDEAAQAEREKSPRSQQRFVVEYYYKAKWGHADEFIELFRKNHFPVLRRQVETGRLLEVTAVKPRYHATEEGRWDYRVTIVYKDVEAAFAPAAEEEAIKRELYPDQETFRREEQRRFQILEAHWDVPIEEVELDRRTPR